MTYIFALNTCTMKLKVNFILKFSLMLNIILFVQYNIYEKFKYRCKFIKTLKALMPSVILFWNYIQMHRCKINNVMNMYLNMYLCQYMIVIIITVDFLHIIMAIICISSQRIERDWMTFQFILSFQQEPRAEICPDFCCSFKFLWKLKFCKFIASYLNARLIFVNTKANKNYNILNKVNRDLTLQPEVLRQQNGLKTYFSLVMKPIAIWS